MIHYLEGIIKEELAKGTTIKEIKENPDIVLLKYREIRDKGRLSLTN